MFRDGRCRSSYGKVPVVVIESVFEAWLSESVQNGHARDITALLKESIKILTWKTAVPPLHVESYPLVEKFAHRCLALLISNKRVTRVIEACSATKLCVKNTCDIEDLAGTIRCILTRWRELKAFPDRLRAIMHQALQIA